MSGRVRKGNTPIPETFREMALDGRCVGGLLDGVDIRGATGNVLLVVPMLDGRHRVHFYRRGCDLHLLSDGELIVSATRLGQGLHKITRRCREMAELLALYDGGAA